MCGQFVDRLAFESYLAVASPYQTGNSANGGTLARAIGSDHGYDLALLHFQGNAIQRLYRPVVNFQI